MISSAQEEHDFYPYSAVPLMKLLKVVLKVEGSADLNDPAVQEAVLKHVSLTPPLIL